MLHGSEDEHQNNWRTACLLQTFIAPLPVIGPFLKTSNYKEAIYHSGRQATMLLGGTAFMLLDLAESKMEDSHSTRYGKGLAIKCQLALPMTTTNFADF